MGHPKVGLYLRLSREDEREGESSSIENQRSYLKQYIKKMGWTAAREYVDDGWSGLRFDRPQFQELLADIERGAIDTVLTKDLSRLGRDQIFTAYYYQIYFPQRNVRYISVAEGFDSAQAGVTNALFPFLTAANDFYTADVSRKVRAALTARKREGKFIGAQPPLGYRKDPAQPGHLLPEEETAPVIRHIFRCYQRLGSVSGVARELTEQGVPTPSRFQGREDSSGVWSPTMVRRILSNPTYAGHLTQNRRVKVNYKIKKRKNLPEEEWITVPNTHQALVGQAQFDQVQELLARRSYRPKTGGGGHLLTGLAFCGTCGSPMTYVRESPGRVYMVCQRYRKGGREKLCTAHCVREDRVLRTIQWELRRLTGGVDRDSVLSKCAREIQAEAPLSGLKKALEQQNRLLHRLYQDWASGVVTEEEFLEMVRQIRTRRSALERQLEQNAPAQSGEETRYVGQILEEILAVSTLDRQILTALMKEVRIHEDKTLEMILRFQETRAEEV